MKRDYTTASWAIGAALSVGLVYADPWRDSGALRPTFVSTRSAARKVFPALLETSASPVAVTMTAAGRPSVALEDRGAETRVLVDGQYIGPADPEGWEGLLASLRAASTLRAVPVDAPIGPSSGELEVAWGSGRTRVELHDATSDGAGVYATWMEDGDRSTWAVEHELAELLTLPPEAWLLRRLLPWSASDVVAVRYPGGDRLHRGADGLWRLEGARGPALLSAYAVEARIDRVLATSLGPWKPDLLPDETWRSALELESLLGEVASVRIGGTCEPHDAAAEAHVVVDRGGGWPGCVPAGLLDPWPQEVDAVLEPRLVPYDLERVLRIEQVAPLAGVLRRHQGDWRWVEGRHEKTVDGAEVRRWYAMLHEAEAMPSSAVSPPAEPPALQWRIMTDSAVTLTLTCHRANETWACQRDDGPLLEVPGLGAAWALNGDRFEPRQLLTFAPEDAIALEITDTPGSSSVRQSVHFDLGVWRLDAPEHPDGDQALSEVALEQLLATLGSLRVDAWTSMPADPPVRRIGIELRPRRERPARLELELFDGCVVAVDGRAAQVDPTRCERLGLDLLHGDPLAFWLDRASGLEVVAEDQGTPIRWRREGDSLVAEDPAGTTAVPLASWRAVRNATVEPGLPPSPPRWRLRIRPPTGPAIEVDIGIGWAQLPRSPWHYRWPSESDR